MKHVHWPLLCMVALYAGIPATSQAIVNPCATHLNLKGVAPNLELSLNDELGSTPTSIDSPPLTKAGGNPYRAIGTWSTAPLTDYSNDNTRCWGAFSSNSIFRPHVWLGLRDSDDQGTKFDLLAQVLLDGIEIGEAEVHCVEGVTRNPSKAVEVIIGPVPPPATPPHSIAQGPTLPTDSELMLRISARIGTDADGPCKGHSSSKGLRLYYDSVTEPAHMLWLICVDPCLPPIRD